MVLGSRSGRTWRRTKVASVMALGSRSPWGYIHSDTERREAEVTSSEDSGEEDDVRSWTNEPLRYMAVMRVPWLNRRSRRDEWGFHCVGCDDLREWPNHARRD